MGERKDGGEVAEKVRGLGGQASCAINLWSLPPYELFSLDCCLAPFFSRLQLCVSVQKKRPVLYNRPLLLLSCCNKGSLWKKKEEVGPADKYPFSVNPQIIQSSRRGRTAGNSFSRRHSRKPYIQLFVPCFYVSNSDVTVQERWWFLEGFQFAESWIKPCINYYFLRFTEILCIRRSQASHLVDIPK